MTHIISVVDEASVETGIDSESDCESVGNIRAEPVKALGDVFFRLKSNDVLAVDIIQRGA